MVLGIDLIVTVKGERWEKGQRDASRQHEHLTEGVEVGRHAPGG